MARYDTLGRAKRSKNTRRSSLVFNKESQPCAVTTTPYKTTASTAGISLWQAAVAQGGSTSMVLILSVYRQSLSFRRARDNSGAERRRPQTTQGETAARSSRPALRRFCSSVVVSIFVTNNNEQEGDSRPSREDRTTR